MFFARYLACADHYSNAAQRIQCILRLHTLFLVYNHEVQVVLVLHKAHLRQKGTSATPTTPCDRSLRYVTRMPCHVY
jgi:hypothetical protein